MLTKMYWFSVKLAYHKRLDIQFIIEVITCTMVELVVIIVGLIHHKALVCTVLPKGCFHSCLYFFLCAMQCCKIV